MSFNLLNTTLNAGNTTSELNKKFPLGLTMPELDKLEAANIVSASQAREMRQNAGLTSPLAKKSTQNALTNAGLSTKAVPIGGPEEGGEIKVTAERPTDNRLRISALRACEARIYGPNDRTTNVLAPLYSTGGMMFPYTPSVQVAGDTDWTPHTLTHTNYDIYSYQRTPSATISVSGKFTVQNQREGEYALACIHFLRTMGKMYYGEQDSSDYDPQQNDQTQSNAGLPPPVLRLRGYGLYMFTDVKVVLKNYSFNFEETMDLVTIQSPSGGDIMLPPMFTISVSLLLQQNTTNLRKNFKLDDFRTGALMRDGKGWF